MVVALTFGLAGAGVATAGAASTTPPCTRLALQTGLKRGFDTHPQGTVVAGFVCAGAWAAAPVNVGQSPHRITITSLFHARAGRWVTVNRGPACSKHAVPQRIHKPACDSN